MRQNLATPPAGDAYYAWIIDEKTEGVTNLGECTEKGQIWSLTYNGCNSNLLGAGDKLEVTLERGEVQALKAK